MVMQDWSESYKIMLISSKMLIDLLRGYVDDGRQGSSILPIGMRFEKENNKFEYNEAAAIEDKTLKETDNQRMARICLPAMNSIN